MKKVKSLFLTIMAFLIFTSSSLYATNIKDLKDKKKGIESESKELKQKLDEIALERKKLEDTIAVMDDTLNQAENELELVTIQLDETKERLTEAVIELSEAEAAKDKQYEALKERIRFMYENGNIGYLDVLLSSKNFGDFINQVENINQIMEYDNNLVEQLAETEQIIAERVDEITVKKIQEELLFEEQETKTNQLQMSYDEKKKMLDEALLDEKTYSANLASLEEASNSVEKLIKAKEAEFAAESKKANSRKSGGKTTKSGSSTSQYSGGIMMWPVQGRITSSYGGRNRPIGKGTEFHTGIDIANAKGNGVAAGADGTVIYSGWMNGYGNTIIIDHGGGVTTLYAHNSSLVAGVGASVSKGTIVAKVGSTGNSTGPHCHFEVRINGRHTNPIPYLSQ